MTNSVPSSAPALFRRPVRNVCVFLFLWCVAGCDKGRTYYPVSGIISLNQTPLVQPGLSMSFVPDKQQGNESSDIPRAQIGSEGRYVLYSEAGKRGALEGWYTVTVRADPPSLQPGLRWASPIHARYATAATSPLHVQVVPKPESGSYDIELIP